MDGIEGMTFDRVVDIWQDATRGKTLVRRAFVVESPMDAAVVEGVNIVDCFRPRYVGRFGKTIAWAYAECANGERVTAKIKEDASAFAVTKMLEWFVDVASGPNLEQGG
jgi:hypothetical protein